MIGPLMPRMSELHGNRLESDLRALTLRATRLTIIACGRHRAHASWSLGEALATVLLGVSLIGPYGLARVATAMILPRIVVNTTVQPWYVLRVVGLPFTEYVKAARLRPLLVNAIFLAVCLAANRFAPAAGLGGFVWAVTGDIVVFLALAYAIGLTPSSRQAVRARSRQAAARLFVLAGARTLPVEPIPTLPLGSVPSASNRPPGRRRPS
jgi:hypothetical protein